MRKKLPMMLLLAVFVRVWCYGQDKVEIKPFQASLPRITIKTNLLYDGTANPNLGMEFRVGKKNTLDVPVSWNPFTFQDNRKWRHLLVQPEIRFWSCEPFNGHFFGIHAHYAMYNAGNLNFGNLKDYRFEGWLAGAGVTYGYQFYLGPRFNLELAVGAGYAYLDYTKYECPECGKEIGKETMNYFGPTKAAISLIYFVK